MLFIDAFEKVFVSHHKDYERIVIFFSILSRISEVKIVLFAFLKFLS
ncbi:hypothetical protein J2736_003098 [Paenibacillus qinlingensis]|uniref:Uncharacterized protein n=1 Tax=Paenibacillus qinlingensis TaxID=1837343 RepID=A0ABU1NWQ3_9BACL|nr:hypothetical protein [Paenibacillus qinlingensis]